MASVPKDGDETYSAEEAARRRDEVIRRMANTPPQAKPKKGRSASRSKVKAKSRKTTQVR